MAESVCILFCVSIDLDSPWLLESEKKTWPILSYLCQTSLVSNAFVFWLYEGRIDDMSYLILF